MNQLAVVDLSLDRAGPDGLARLAAAVDHACRTVGFFCIEGHGVDPDRLRELDQLAREFFTGPIVEREAIAMAKGGRAWRGWFPLGDEVTSGQPDQKSGLYFGIEHAPDDPRVQSGHPLCGPNLFPSRPVGLRDAVLGWMTELTAVAGRVLRAMAVGLGLDAQWFEVELTADPTILFRIFHYPPTSAGWGVGEHTDYGLLTLLAQDDCGGLQVRTPQGWIDVPARPDLLVCNLGDMLDRMTSGRYRSTPHRVRNSSGRDRLSFPFFFDPGWDARIEPLPLLGDAPPDDAVHRWDATSLRDLRGTYGDYLLAKVSKVFPSLADAHLPPADSLTRPGRTQT